MSLRRIAVSRFHFPDGRVLYNQIVELDSDVYVRHYPLTDELPFTEWRGGDYFLPAAKRSR